MPLYRSALPQLTGSRSFLTDGGFERALSALDDVDAPRIAASELLRTARGTARLRRYYESRLELARSRGLGFVLDTPTWRADPDRMRTLELAQDGSEPWISRSVRTGGIRLPGAAPLSTAIDPDDVFREINRAAVAVAAEIRDRLCSEGTPIVIAGGIGPRIDEGDDRPRMSVEEARAYHGRQLGVLARTEVDFACALTLTDVDEAIGMTLAARDVGLPVVVSFTVGADGLLPGGATLREAVEAVDTATGAYPSYFMVDCAHPTSVPAELADGSAWTHRVRGVRADATSDGPADSGEVADPDDLAARLVALRARIPQLNVLGGCCGTDLRHLDALARALAA